MADANNLTLKDKIAIVTIVVSIVALPISIFRVKSLFNRKSAVEIYDIREGEKKCSGGEWLG